MVSHEYETYTHMHSQSGLTALKVAQSEGHQDVCDILLQYTQQGSKVISPEPEERQVKKRKAELAIAEVGVDDRNRMSTCQLH